MVILSSDLHKETFVYLTDLLYDHHLCDTHLLGDHHLLHGHHLIISVMISFSVINISMCIYRVIYNTAGATGDLSR